MINYYEFEDQKILNENNPANSYWHCCYSLAQGLKVNLEKHLEIILSHNAFFYAYMFARNINSSNLEKITEVILKANCDFYYALEFLIFFKNKLDPRRFEDVMIRSNRYDLIYKFATMFEVNKLKLFKKVIELNNIDQIKEFYNLDFDKSKIEHLLMFL